MKNYVLHRLKRSAVHLRNLELNATQNIPGEDVLAVYRNTGGENVVFTDVALHSLATGRIEYKEIGGIDFTGEKMTVRSLEIKLDSGRSVYLPVDGGDDRHRDAFVMMTFLRRVRWGVHNKDKI